MPPRRSRKADVDDDDGYDDTDNFSEIDDQDEGVDLMSEASDEDSIMDEEDEEDEEEDERMDKASELYNDFQSVISEVALNHNNILTKAKEFFTVKLYENFEEAINKYDKLTVTIVSKVARQVIDQHFEDEEEEEEEEDLVALDIEEKKEKLRTEVKTYPSLFSQILSPFEKTGIIGFRSQQIASGAEIYVETYPNDTPFIIAERELKEHKLPYYLDRQLPDGTYVSVKLDNLLDVN